MAADRTRLTAVLLVVAAVAVPAVLWHDTITAIASAFRLEVSYLVMGWTPWVLMALGLACFIPVAVETVRDPRAALRAARHRRLVGVGRDALPAGLPARHPGRADRRPLARHVGVLAA